MKAIVIKEYDKVVYCEQVVDLTTAQFVEYKKQVEETLKLKDDKINELYEILTQHLTMINELEKCVLELRHENKVIRGLED